MLGGDLAMLGGVMPLASDLLFRGGICLKSLPTQLLAFWV